MTNLIIHNLVILFWALLKCSLPGIKTGQSANTPGSNNQVISGYNLSSPDAVVVLPIALREISGLTFIDTSVFACVQDEKGTLFLFHRGQNEVIASETFYSNGDFEDLCRVGQSIFVLRSDATLFEIENYEDRPLKTISYGLNIPAYDNEGLCFDKENNRLLIASKGNSGKGEEFKNKREIYGFDLKTKSLIETPVFTFDEKLLKQFAIDQNIQLPVKVKKSGKTEPDIKFRPTAIGIHPMSKKLFLLSGPDQMFFIFSPQGVIEHLEALDAELFTQPEGLSFLENGDLFISNEGQNKQATLLRFNYKPL
ncbi:MAG: hypothetical protein SH818_02575 [Saprospiraceae bacterium]|nr:hypothetical protein [Saprospiraceae bacterium]